MRISALSTDPDAESPETMPRRSDWPDTLTPAAFHILMALADEERHGLGIVEEVARRTRGEVQLGPGTLYGTIKRLREAGLIEEVPASTDRVDHDPRRRYYGITARGREALAREARRMEVMVHVARAKAVLDSAEGK
jgi:DNA-binding PadR family transcriptional regulator